MRTTNTKHPATGRSPDYRRGRPRSAILLIAALICAALLLAACGGSSNNASGSSKSHSSGSSNASASAGGGSGTSEDTSDTSKAEKFSQCMRANGVPNFPDPGANGTISLTVTPTNGLDPTSSGFKAALAKCKSLEPAGFGQSPGSSVANQNKLLSFVSCMRKNGVPKFPDPGSQGQMVISSSSGVDPNSPAFQSAMQKCRSLLPNGGAGASASAG